MPSRFLCTRTSLRSERLQLSMKTEQAESGGHADKPWMPGAPRTSLSGLHCTLGQITALSGRLLRSLSCLLRHIKGQRVSWPVMLVIDKLSRDSSGQGAPPSSLFCTLLESLRSPFGSLALPWGVLHSNYSWVMTANTSVGCKRQEACKEAVTGGGVSVLGWNYNSRESGPPTKPSFVYSAVHFSTLTIPNSTQLCCTPYYCTF